MFGSEPPNELLVGSKNVYRFVVILTEHKLQVQKPNEQPKWKKTTTINKSWEFNELFFGSKYSFDGFWMVDVNISEWREKM